MHHHTGVLFRHCTAFVKSVLITIQNKMLKFVPSYSLLSVTLGGLFWLAGPYLFAQIPTKQQVYDSINAMRVRSGLAVITVDKKLERSAQSWAVFMPYDLKHNVHFLYRFNRTGAECLAVGSDPVSDWIKSPPHRHCIMGKGIKAMGLGYWRGKWVWRSFTSD